MEVEVGFLGLGIMGKAMSMNLLRHGFRVTVWNRTLSRCDELVELGASVAETPAAVVKKCTYTIAILSDPSAALSLVFLVVFDKDGVLEEICSGKGYIDMSTVDCHTLQRSVRVVMQLFFAYLQAITSKGGYFLEAPVSGSKKQAEDGQLVILAAGEKALYDEVLPAFNVMGKNMMNAFSEGLTLADKSGLNPQTLLDVLDLGGIANPMFRMKGPAMLQKSYSPHFPLKHQQKDMRLALSLADDYAVSMPVAAAANESENMKNMLSNAGD
ncbi:unnamed protein product [Thlaspi arvense]|uniref:6-phosphogluconate dehydrogenase NADP-binding domain-containing protein n=1 Tax=Thlaspi arvense TaxID=13288 RepID=A0AAU9RHG1_THLAR|nr:unnamed protein product [Thlaspi arvense]